jgi:hypothetical protein
MIKVRKEPACRGEDGGELPDAALGHLVTEAQGAEHVADEVESVAEARRFAALVVHDRARAAAEDEQPTEPGVGDPEHDGDKDDQGADGNDRPLGDALAAERERGLQDVAKDEPRDWPQPLTERTVQATSMPTRSKNEIPAMSNSVSTPQL